MRAPTVIVRGGGDIATGTIDRLYRAGCDVLVTEIEKPTVIRLNVAAATSIFTDEIDVEGIRYVKVDSVDQINSAFENRTVPVIIDPDLRVLKRLKPDLLVDATLAKKNFGLQANLAPVVIALGPGFEVPVDCDAVIETSRGHDLGRVYYEGRAKDDTGIPGDILGFTEERILRAPASGKLIAELKIGDLVKRGDVIGQVDGKDLTSNIDGVIRGLIHAAVDVKQGMKIGDVDPRGAKEACSLISDKARALGGSVLEAYLKLTGGLKI